MNQVDKQIQNAFPFIEVIQLAVFSLKKTNKQTLVVTIWIGQRNNQTNKQSKILN